MKKYKVIIVVAIVFLIGISVSYHYTASNLQDDVIEIEGVIRNSGNGWELISDNAHESYGIQKISVESDRIKILHKNNIKKVRTFIVTPDETMSKQGYTTGVSAGLDYSYIYVYDKNKNQINPAKYVNKNANIWIYARFSDK